MEFLTGSCEKASGGLSISVRHQNHLNTFRPKVISKFSSVVSVTIDHTLFSRTSASKQNAVDRVDLDIRVQRTKIYR
jgi:hypothetical protein